MHMPFGLCNAPATFQCLMQVVLSGLEGKFCFVYIDDILVCSNTFEEHIDHLKQVLQRLRKAGLALKQRKCCFLKKEVNYLGHIIISGKGIAHDPAKTRKVHDYPVPTDLTKVHQYLGLASYYRRFLPGFAKVAHPLYQLMKKGVAFEWDTACQQHTPVPSYPQFDPDAQFILETDASSLGLGAVLAQKQDDGRVHPVAYASHTLNAQEKNCGITEMETLAEFGQQSTFVHTYSDTTAQYSQIIPHA